MNLNLLEGLQRIEVRGRNEREVEDCIKSAFNQVFDSEAQLKLRTANRKYAADDFDRGKEYEEFQKIELEKQNPNLRGIYSIW